MKHTVGSSVFTSVLTGLVAVVPPSVLGFAEKAISVFVLAMVAEAGRQIIMRLRGIK